MLYEEKLKLLKAMRLLSKIPDRQLAGLAEFLRPKPLEDGAIVFKEGSTGMSLYFVSSGRIRITKEAADGTSTDLAILGAGDFFGEMALIEQATRSASAVAVGASVLFELFHGDLSRWVKLNPQQAVQFFAELVHLQSDRLRRTSNELILHSDLSHLLFERKDPAAALLPRVLERVLPRLDGGWSAAAYLCGAAGAFDLVAAQGAFKFEAAAASGAEGAGWLDASSFHVTLKGADKTLGRLVFHRQAPVAKQEQDEIGRTLMTVGRMTSSALELRQLTGK